MLEYYVRNTEKKYDSICNERPDGKYHGWIAVVIDDKSEPTRYWYCHYTEQYYSWEGTWESPIGPHMWLETDNLKFLEKDYKKVTAEECSNADIAWYFSFKEDPEKVKKDKSITIETFFKEFGKDSYNKEKFTEYATDSTTMSFNAWMDLYIEWLCDQARAGNSVSTSIECGSKDLRELLNWELYEDQSNASIKLIYKPVVLPNDYHFIRRFSNSEDGMIAQNNLTIWDLDLWCKRRHFTQEYITEFKKWLLDKKYDITESHTGDFWYKMSTAFASEKIKESIHTGSTTDLKTVMKWLLDGLKVSRRPIHIGLPDSEVAPWEDVDLEADGLSTNYEYRLTPAKKKYKLSLKDCIYMGDSPDGAFDFIKANLNREMIILEEIEE